MPGPVDGRPRAGAVPDLAAASKALNGMLDGAGAAADTLRAAANCLDHADREIGALAPNALSRRRLPSIGDELDAIRRDTGQAIERIISAAEALLSARPDDPERYAELVAEQAIAILEACCVDDITSQRVARAVGVLSVVESRMAAFVAAMRMPADASEDETPAERRAREALLGGPAAHAVDQDRIDALFDAPAG